MTKKEKFLYVVISIITFGIYPIMINKKIPEASNKMLSEAKKVTVDVPKLVKNLGGDNNISAIEYTHSKLKIFIKDSAKIDIESINKQKGITGVVFSSKTVTIIVGNQAKQLSKMI